MKKINLPLWALLSLVPLFVGIAYLEVLWLDWIIQSILNKDINRWILFASIFMIGVATPKKLAGLPVFLFALSTIYIWIVL